MVFTNGDSYFGAFVDGKRSGEGVYKWSSGDEYNGDWHEDKMEGSGEYKYSNGNYAKGTFKMNTFSDGDYYCKNDAGTYEYSVTDYSQATAPPIA